jgi:hypothetical protein
VRRGYDEYEGRQKRAQGGLRAARAVADAAAARHAAERVRHEAAGHTLLAARARLGKAKEHLAAIHAADDVAEVRRQRAADLEARARRRKRDARKERARTNPAGTAPHPRP